ncbi:DoxX family protein [Prosthecomicrobium pneumaticum]|uniref:DoxX family protein n=1 Tax=Prosthecomicrobium pneumaticum TaxID=81895 RepID=A0A7W9FKY1_9HYPH|nr:DoxX family protein [Prosthecomicrobium pneumaticum]MBB5751694.1 hypothetical protein [Prosthecomicrobium pneumaticum]
MSAGGGTAMPRRTIVAGWTISGIVIAFLVMDGGAKLVPFGPVIETMAALGWPGDVATARGLGIVLLAITALYGWPGTSVLGAVLLTAYLGGAVATHARIGSPLVTHTLFGVYIGGLAWLGLWLRMPALRRIVLPREG